MSDRTHFVYRAFDEFGSLLYIGCTKQPIKRWKQHVAERHTWTQYAQRFHVTGPFERQDAFDREREAIHAERPHFNCLPEHRAADGARNKLRNRLLRGLAQRRPDLYDADFCSPAFKEFERAVAEIDAQVDRECPALDDRWRHRQYLAAIKQRGAAA